jgi:hypothetical protein
VPTPIAQPVWDAYLQTHFRPNEAVQVGRGSVEVSVKDMAVPLGRGRDVEALLRQSAQNHWMPVPVAAVTPSESVMQMLVAEQIKKMNGRASPGFDCVAAPFIKHAVVIRARTEGHGTERVNVSVPYFGRLYKLLHDRPAYLPAGSTRGSFPYTRRGHSLTQTAIACWL